MSKENQPTEQKDVVAIIHKGIAFAQRYRFETSPKSYRNGLGYGYSCGYQDGLAAASQSTEQGQEAVEFYEWMNDEVNPFIKMENGRYVQACGNSTSWDLQQLYRLFTNSKQKV